MITVTESLDETVATEQENLRRAGKASGQALFPTTTIVV